MKTDEVVTLIQAGIPGATVIAEGQDCSFSVTVISDTFAGLTPVKKQQMVLATCRDQIQSGALHALSIEALTPDQWQGRLVSL